MKYAVVISNSMLEGRAREIFSRDVKILTAGQAVVGHRFDHIFLLDWAPTSAMESQWFNESLACRLAPGGQFIVVPERIHYSNDQIRQSSSAV